MERAVGGVSFFRQKNCNHGKRGVDPVEHLVTIFDEARQGDDHLVSGANHVFRQRGQAIAHRYLPTASCVCVRSVLARYS